ncbi:MAG: hypothetical protein ACK5BV_07235 [Bacteroidota bacterium]
MDMLSVRETTHLTKRLKLRSFAYAQDDASEICGAGKAERAERSGLPVMLSVSETSHFAKPSP